MQLEHEPQIDNHLPPGLMLTEQCLMKVSPAQSSLLSPALKQSGQVPMHTIRVRCWLDLYIPCFFQRHSQRGRLRTIILLWTALEKLELGTARAG